LIIVCRESVKGRSNWRC